MNINLRTDLITVLHGTLFLEVSQSALWPFLAGWLFVVKMSHAQTRQPATQAAEDLGSIRFIQSKSGFCDQK